MKFRKASHISHVPARGIRAPRTNRNRAVRLFIVAIHPLIYRWSQNIGKPLAKPSSGRWL